jgi:hypothetical protein
LWSKLRSIGVTWYGLNKIQHSALFVFEILICHILAVWWCSFAENYIPLIMKNKEYTHLRTQVQKVEEKILTITGKNVEFNMEWTRSQRNDEYSIF